MSNKSAKNEVYLILDNLRSLYNVGAIFRTAEACRVAKIFLIGPTGILLPENPKDKRKPVLHPKLTKTALCTEKQVLWRHYWNIKQAIKDLPQNTTIVALEQTENSINYSNFNYQLPLALIVGNETAGVGSQALKAAKTTIYIPMYGQHKSLNVSVACGIVLYKILENRLR